VHGLGAEVEFQRVGEVFCLYRHKDFHRDGILIKPGFEALQQVSEYLPFKSVPSFKISVKTGGIGEGIE